MNALPLDIQLLLVRFAAQQDPTPEAEDVTAGWVGLAVSALLIGLVVLLFFSLVKQLRRVQAARDAGVYGDVAPVEKTAGADERPADGPADRPADRPAQPPTISDE